MATAESLRSDLVRFQEWLDKRGVRGVSIANTDTLQSAKARSLAAKVATVESIDEDMSTELCELADVALGPHASFFEIAITQRLTDVALIDSKRATTNSLQIVNRLDLCFTADDLRRVGIDSTPLQREALVVGVMERMGVTRPHPKTIANALACLCHFESDITGTMPCATQLYEFDGPRLARNFPKGVHPPPHAMMVYPDQPSTWPAATYAATFGDDAPVASPMPRIKSIRASIPIRSTSKLLNANSAAATRKRGHAQIAIDAPPPQYRIDQQHMHANLAICDATGPSANELRLHHELHRMRTELALVTAHDSAGARTAAARDSAPTDTQFKPPQRAPTKSQRTVAELSCMYDESAAHVHSRQHLDTASGCADPSNTSGGVASGDTAAAVDTNVKTIVPPWRSKTAAAVTVADRPSQHVEPGTEAYEEHMIQVMLDRERRKKNEQNDARKTQAKAKAAAKALAGKSGNGCENVVAGTPNKQRAAPLGLPDDDWWTELGLTLTRGGIGASAAVKATYSCEWSRSQFLLRPGNQFASITFPFAEYPTIDAVQKACAAKADELNAVAAAFYDGSVATTPPRPKLAKAHTPKSGLKPHSATATSKPSKMTAKAVPMHKASQSRAIVKRPASKHACKRNRS